MNQLQLEATEPRPRPAPPPTSRATSEQTRRWRDLLVSFALDALAGLPDTAELPIEELVASGALSENLHALCAKVPAVSSPRRWRNVAWCLGKELERIADAHARAAGHGSILDALRDPFVGLELVEQAISEGWPTPQGDDA